MSTTKILTTPLLAVLLVGVAWVIKVTAGIGSVYTLEDTDICIPEAYAVPLPSVPPSDAHLYDESEGYDVSASIDREEVGINIKGYKEKVMDGDDVRSQGLYLSLYPVSEKSLEVDSPESFVRMKASPDLFIQDQPPLPLEPLKVLEKDGATYKKWGVCTRMSLEDRPVRFECDRLYLRTGPLRVDYEIDEENLHLHEEIDEFIEKKLNQWRCD